MKIDLTRGNKIKETLPDDYWARVHSNNTVMAEKKRKKSVKKEKSAKKAGIMDATAAITEWETEKKTDKLNQKNLKPKKRKACLQFTAYWSIAIIIIIFIFSKQIASSNNSVIETFGKFLSFGYPGVNGGSSISRQGRINILFMGIAGKNHDGGNLADTIMLASIEPTAKKIALISIPRDLVAPMGNLGYRKINAANAYAEAEKPGSGGEYTAKIAENILGVNIPYYIRTDFRGFEKVIDELGSIQINVEQNFTDKYYPDEDYKYQTISFKSGWQKMDGDKALIYVRSRHGNNGEGSDFARAARQQKVLEAVKEKATSFTTFLNPRRISHLLDIFEEHISTNLDVWDLLELAKIAKTAKNENIIREVIDASPNGLLYEEITEEGAFILLPKTPKYADIKKLVQNIFEDNKPKINGMNAKIEVQNGTTITGLASRTAEHLRSLKYDVVRIRNAKKQNFERTTIYDLTSGQKPKELLDLKKELSAELSLTLPSWIINNEEEIPELSNFTSADFLVILGDNADDTKTQSGNN